VVGRSLSSGLSALDIGPRHLPRSVLPITALGDVVQGPSRYRHTQQPNHTQHGLETGEARG
jgi:hypothetical protein